MQQLVNLIRICVISIVLSIGYAINVASILQSVINGELTVEIWTITYTISSAFLFILCLLMIFISFCGVFIELLSTRNRRMAIFMVFFICVCGYVASLIIGIFYQTDNSDKHISWQYELLYALLPLYLATLVYFFDDERLSQITRLILFSLIIFVTPCINLVFLILHNENALSSHHITVITAYLCICIATSILILIHIICMCTHYNSGLFLKLVIIVLLACGITVLIGKKIDIDTYGQIYRMYYYYALVITLCIIYSFEIFVKSGIQKIVSMRIPTIMESKSFNWGLERDATVERDDHEIRGILQLVGLTGIKKDGGYTKVSLRDIDSSCVPLSDYIDYNPNEKIESVIKIFADFKPIKENKDKYFDEIELEPHYLNDSDKKRIDRKRDSISAIVPFYNEKASEIHATLRSLYLNFEFIKSKNTKYKFTHFNVLLVGDGWFKADISTQRYLTKLYNIKSDNKDGFEQFNDYFKQNEQKHQHNTVILQTKYNKKLCINPFKNKQKKLYLKVTTIIKIDNRKKANSHEWFLGKYGFAEWCQCDYMFFTDAYSTTAKESLYRCIQHMNQEKNQDVICCTGRARVYTIEQELDFQNLLREEAGESDETKVVDNEQKYDDNEEIKVDEQRKVYKWWTNDIFKADDEKKIDVLYDDDNTDTSDNVFYKIQDSEFDHRLTTNAHIRDCQMFEFEALYGTIGSYLLGGFMPVIPGPCGFYRSEYLLKDKVRGWYFEKINQANDPSDIDLVLGNMKLAEDRILTISSILNYDKRDHENSNIQSVRHSLIPECVFYFDPMPNLTQLMKQRRRWLNGSIATVIFILRKISFAKWRVNIFRRYYVLSMWYMQLIMYIVTAVSPPLIFIIAINFGLATILDVILIDHGDNKKLRNIKIVTRILMAVSWMTYLVFIYFMQRGKDLKVVIRGRRIFEIKKASIVQFTLVITFFYGILILIGTLMQIVNMFRPDIIPDDDGIVTKWFSYSVVIIMGLFFFQPFVLAPLVSKDFKTFQILVKTFFNYFLYAPFYVTYFFINAIANLHDLSWGTRPDEEAEDENNPKQTTIKTLLIIIFVDVIVAISVSPLTEYIWAYLAFFILLAFPSLYQIFFSLIWITKAGFSDLWNLCRPKKIKVLYEYPELKNKQYAD